MNSNILNKVGLDKIDPGYIIIALLMLIILLFVLHMINISRFKKLNRKYEKFMSGKDAETLEGAMFERFKELDTLMEENKKKTKQIKQIFDNLDIAVQKVGIVKYDAFGEMGGKLSFALVMLNKVNSGYVINAMHSREGCYTYIKEIIKGESYIPLGEEEKKALEKAMEQ